MILKINCKKLPFDPWPRGGTFFSLRGVAFAVIAGGVVLHRRDGGSVVEEQDPRAVLRDYVAKKGLKFTRQREMIADVFFKAGGHLRVEDLLDKVRSLDPQVSLATVYRTMKLLTEIGLASPHRFGDRITRYEPSEHDHEHHDHLICTACGKIVEFMDEKIEHLQHSVAKANGFQVTHHKMELYGLCADCQERN